MKQFIFLLLATFIFNSCVPTTSSSNRGILEYTDKNYVNNVGIVRITSPLSTNEFQNPITRLGNPITISFDLLEEDYSFLTAKIFHCNADWTKSVLSNLEFLDEYNEFRINQYEFSQNTEIPYTQYSVTIPGTKKTGNYILAIYEGSSPILSRRFMVFEQKCQVDAEIRRSDIVNERQSHHQINFSVGYGSLEVVRPNSDIKPVILQNHNWNTIVSGLVPTSVRTDQSLLEYFSFGGENSIPAWNEFRFFDTRTLANRGLQIKQVYRKEDGIHAVLQDQSPRTNLAFSENFHDDLNGNFLIGNRDLNETDIQSEYVWTSFRLESTIDGDVFVTGKYNNWNLTSKNRLQFDSLNNSYSGKILMKQGYYNYLFWLRSENQPAYYLEGSHFQTVNEYEILVYYRAPGTLYDQLVGYNQF